MRVAVGIEREERVSWLKPSSKGRSFILFSGLYSFIGRKPAARLAEPEAGEDEIAVLTGNE
jgi:hypothetical protein